MPVRTGFTSVVGRYDDNSTDHANGFKHVYYTFCVVFR